MGWLRRRFIFATAALLLLTLAAAGYVLREINTLARARGEQQLLETTRALSLVVDGQLRQFEALLKGLVGSEALSRNDFPAFDARARAILSGPDAWIVVGRRDGSQLVNTRLPAGATLGSGSAPVKAFAALDKGQTHICDLTRGRVVPQILCVDVPIVRNGRTAYHLSVIFRPSFLQRIIEGQRIERSHFATILDSRGIVVWRNAAPERFVGGKATPDIRAALARSREGVRESISLDGTPTIAAYSRSASGYSFIVAVPRAELWSPGSAALRSGLIIAGLLMLVAIAIAFLAGRYLANAITSLSQVARQFAASQPIAFKPTGIPEVDRVGAALERGAAERVAAQKASEDALRTSRDRLAAVLDTTPAAILIATDPDCLTIEGNAPAADLMRMASNENLSRSDPSAKTNHFRVFDPQGREVADYDLPVQRAARGEELWMYEERVEFDDGRSVHLLGNAVPLRGADGKIEGAVGAFIDITERKRAEEHQQLLISELNHRVKNTLAIVQSLAQQSFKGSVPVEVSRAAFEARLTALAAAHNLLTRENWEAADLADVVRTSVLAAAGAKASRVTIEGPSLKLAPQTSVSVAMAIHELCTNAIKYGALSVDEGRVTVEWQVTQDARGERLRLEWREQDGPPVAAPASRGFGSRMIERGLAGELGGEARLHFDEKGLRCIIDTPLPRSKS